MCPTFGHDQLNCAYWPEEEEEEGKKKMENKIKQLSFNALFLGNKKKTITAR